MNDKQRNKQLTISDESGIMNNKPQTPLQVPWASKGNSLDGIKRAVVVNGERLPMPGPERFPAGASRTCLSIALKSAKTLFMLDKSQHHPKRNRPKFWELEPLKE